MTMNGAKDMPEQATGNPDGIFSQFRRYLRLTIWPGAQRLRGKTPSLSCHWQSIKYEEYFALPVQLGTNMRIKLWKWPRLRHAAQIVSARPFSSVIHLVESRGALLF
jgi:hypothetical protein